MPYNVVIRSKRPLDKLNAMVLVKSVAADVLPYLQQALTDGFRPSDGTPRPRKGDGKPQAYDTGTLARGLHATPVRGSRTRATLEIRVPSSRRVLTEPRGEDRMSFIERHEILTGDGRVAEIIETATRDYLETIE